ncbi:MAG: NYN domain-containing protein [Brasilonema octagenarum HA4186-MV1]|uniref:NYN domain-containing protein n=1 Tax=Brasilonema octagenarum UFV-OR1 TaxID=417115 RepID=A0ABX1M5A6_9CYAN|nr:NYN domain-containing protein [Brasilonema octagenarum]MBW4628072.1 NYN domain-containing protein [Brasilonema octagenarum HA4186-MV1]NMF62995.1 NYN domain-containing protein [Brasilonema octagenarum UFV-OR1]
MQLLPRPQHNNQRRLKLEPEPLLNMTQLSAFEKPDTVSANTLQPCEKNNPDKKLDQRIAIFIDGANLFYSAMHLNLEIDYTKLLRYLTKKRQLLRAYFYTGVDYTNDKQQGFLMWMSRNGYRVVSKELIVLPNGSKKADLDVEIAVDMMTLARYCDTLVLLSGDGDLAYAVDNITYRGVKVEVVGLGCMTNESLIRVADSYTDLELIKQDIQKKVSTQ